MSHLSSAEVEIDFTVLVFGLGEGKADANYELSFDSDLGLFKPFNSFSRVSANGRPLTS